MPPRGQSSWPPAVGLAVAGCGAHRAEAPSSAALSARLCRLAAVGQTVQLTATITDQNGNDDLLPATLAVDLREHRRGHGELIGPGHRRRATARPWSPSPPAPSPRTLTSLSRRCPRSSRRSPATARPPRLGQPVAVPLTVQVNDGSGNPVANVTVTFAAAGGTLGTPNASTGADGRASTGSLTGRDGRAAGDRLGREHVAHDQFHGNRRVAIRDRAPVPHRPPRRPRWRRSRRRGSGGRASSSATCRTSQLNATAGSAARTRRPSTGRWTTS